MSIYRKIYEKANGPIPRDTNGRSYDIHHIDGNRKNNELSNLKCVSLQEHFDIHYSQGDWAACSAIAIRMKMDHNEISRLVKLDCLKRIESGTHHFQKTGPNHHSYNHSIHKFENIYTGESFEGTIAEFMNKTSINSKHAYGLIRQDSKVQTVRGWKIFGKDVIRGRKYKFRNIFTEEVFEGTSLEFRKRYNLNQGNISSLINNKIKTVNNWELISN